MGITLFLVYVIVALFSAALYLLKRRMSYWKDRGIAHDEPTLKQGNFNGLFVTRNYYDIFKETYEKFKGTGPFCGTYSFHKIGVVLLDLDLIKDVLIKDFNNFTDRGWYYNEKDDPLSGHLGHVDGEKWRQLRSKLTPTFTSSKTKFMFLTVKKVADEFVDVFAEATQRSKIVEIKHLLECFSTDVIGSCAFGLECNSLRNPEAKFRIMSRLAVDENPNVLKYGFSNSFPKLARFLGIMRFSKVLNEFFINMIRKTVQYREKNNVQRNDFLNILMELNTSMKSSEGSSGFTLQEMAAHAFVFFLGGFETSSTTLTWALYEIAMNPKVQDKLRTEILDMLQQNNNEFTYESLMEMQYLGQVINETIRKYPAFPHLNRRAVNDYLVKDNPKYLIEKGTRVYIPTAGIHHDPDIYPNPELFDPDRFTPDQMAKRHPMAFLGFGAGPRNCIGMRFGQMQARIPLAYLIKNFKFSPCKETEIPPLRDVSIYFTTPKNGIKLSVERI